MMLHSTSLLFLSSVAVSAMLFAAEASGLGVPSLKSSSSFVALAERHAHKSEKTKKDCPDLYIESKWKEEMSFCAHLKKRQKRKMQDSAVFFRKDVLDCVKGILKANYLIERVGQEKEEEEEKIKKPPLDSSAYSNPQCCVTWGGVELFGPSIVRDARIFEGPEMKKKVLELYARALLELGKDTDFVLSKPFTRMKLEALAMDLFDRPECEDATIKTIESCTGGASFPGDLDTALLEHCAAKRVESPESIPLKYFSLVCSFGVDVDTVKKVQTSADGLTSYLGDKCTGKTDDKTKCIVGIAKDILEKLVKHAEDEGKKTNSAGGVSKVISLLTKLEIKFGEDFHSFLDSPENSAETTLEESIEEVKKETSSFLEQKEEEGKGVALRGASSSANGAAFSSLQKDEEAMMKAWYPGMLFFHYTSAVMKVPTGILTVAFGLFCLPVPIPPFNIMGIFGVMIGLSMLFAAPLQFFLAPLLALLPVSPIA
uniref:Uncharacterized protein n=1 Tax=Chromera velia CCMP2878 TaxID=1169474 RepID=A0A0G4HMC4_9ALVE|eukprot:Cvel_7462.t1-p1 / transcript=Cvel_7462.t1 / gene=Cvel_7462 / organism=Chromera_velia_CCMP2878 / gene_product=hypothetical protein / transcript_product=hypothetical protein / location=Cvel_scaffold390:82157-86672(+) / protein_length=484 / sequence_SO=supercontig / SO=protein_coding / is_pseudo=false